MISKNFLTDVPIARQPAQKLRMIVMVVRIPDLFKANAIVFLESHEKTHTRGLKGRNKKNILQILHFSNTFLNKTNQDNSNSQRYGRK